MRIVHLSETWLSAAPYRLMRVQRVGDPGCHPILVTGSPDTRGRAPEAWYSRVASGGHSLCAYTADDLPFIRDAIKRADVVHAHNRLQALTGIRRVIPDLDDLLAGKRVIAQFHSPREELAKESADLIELVRRNKIRGLVVAQYQWREYRDLGCQPVPNAIPIDDRYHSAIIDERPTFVFYGPSNTNGLGWNDKGWGYTRRALRSLSIPTDIVWDTPLDALLARKRCAHICVDETATGSYHLASLEALSMGQVAIAHVDTLTVDALEQITGTREHPWVVPRKKDAEDLSRTLMAFWKDRVALRQRQAESRSYMEKYWNPPRVAALYRKQYEAL